MKKSSAPTRLEVSTQLETSIRQELKSGKPLKARMLLRGDNATPFTCSIHHIDRYAYLIEEDLAVMLINKHAIEWIRFDDPTFLAPFQDGKRV